MELQFTSQNIQRETPREVSPHQSQLYSRFNHLYDRLFGFLQQRVAQTLRSLSIPPGARILEVGVGTGLSLASYPKHAEITGIDISPGMLAEAKKRCEANTWRHISLHLMDASSLDFPENNFDYATAFHVMAVLPEPVEAMREICRTVRPGGYVILINHFCSENVTGALLGRLADPITRRLGWSLTVKLSDLLRGLPLHIEACYRTPFFSPYQVVIARSKK